MSKLFYPAIFHQEGEGFWVSFPDLPECFTEGENKEQAYEMAFEALGLALASREKEEEDIPVPSKAEEIQADEGVVVVICIDMEEYRRKHSSRAVKKTLSIPEWLNEEALARGINFSQVLQEALIQKIYAK